MSHISLDTESFVWVPQPQGLVIATTQTVAAILYMKQCALFRISIQKRIFWPLCMCSVKLDLLLNLTALIGPWWPDSSNANSVGSAIIDIL